MVSAFHAEKALRRIFVRQQDTIRWQHVLKCLSVSDLELVVTNPLLTLKSEDQLYDAIMSLACENGEEYLLLLRHVEFAFLSETKLSEFLERIYDDLVDSSVWASLCECVRRFCRSGAKEALMKAKRYHTEFEKFTSDNGAFNGIIQHLREECGGNPHEMGVISITASSTDRNQCHQLVDYGWNDYWYSKDQPNSFVQFDFNSRRVCLSGYSLKSHSGAGNYCVSWAIEVSNDCSTWEVVDERNTRDLAGRNIEQTYECNQPSDRFVRFVRMRQTGKTSHKQDYLCLSEIEFFGKLSK